MTQQINLKEAEKRAFRATFQDGLWDIYLGMVFLLFGCLPLLDESGMYRWLAGMIPGVNEDMTNMGVIILYYLIIMGLFWAAKKYITTPRIGMVKFGKDRKRRLIKVRLILTISVLIGIALFLVTWFRLFRFFDGISMVIWIFSIQILLVFGLGAYLLDFTRLYAYMIFLALSFPLGIALTDRNIIHTPTLPFLIPSGLMILVGISLFIRFIINHPAQKDTVIYAGEVMNDNH